LLGLEAAKGCLELGLSTSIIELQKWLMPSQLDEEGGLLFSKQISQIGINLYLGTSLSKIEMNDNQIFVHTNNNEILKTDLLIFSVGIRPRDELARDCDWY